jgi:hypothetical protein
MVNEEIVTLLSGFSKRLATLADMAHETREQAQHLLERINLLRREVEILRNHLVADSDTAEHRAVRR